MADATITYWSLGFKVRDDLADLGFSAAPDVPRRREVKLLWAFGSRGAGMLVTLLLVAAPASAQRYSAVQRGATVTLTDRATDIVVTVVPSVGNIATEMRVKGHNVLRYPHASLAEFAARPAATGIPFMATVGQSPGRIGVLRQRPAPSLRPQPGQRPR